MVEESRERSPPRVGPAYVRDGTISGQKRHWPLRIDHVGLCGGHLRQRMGKTLDRGKFGMCLGSVAIQQVKIDVSARGFQLRGFSGVPDGTGVAVTQRDKEGAI